MSTHNVYFLQRIRKNIPESSSNTHPKQVLRIVKDKLTISVPKIFKKY